MIAADAVDVAGSSMVESTPSFRNAPSSLSYSSRNFLHHKNHHLHLILRLSVLADITQEVLKLWL